MTGSRDLRHKMDLLELVKERAGQQGWSVKFDLDSDGWAIMNGEKTVIQYPSLEEINAYLFRGLDT